MRCRCIVAAVLTLVPAGATAIRQAAPSSPSLIDRLSEPLRALPRHDGAARATPADPGLTKEVDLMIAADFATYDRDRNGWLNRAEFAAWIATLRPDPGAGAASGPWVATAFADADTDHDERVDRRELARFLVRTVGWRLPPGEAGRAGPAPSRTVKSDPAP